MNTDRLYELFERALEIEPERRRVFVDTETSDDPSLGARVWEMIEADAQITPDFLSGEPREPAAAEPGPWLGQYETTELIGEGAMGRVYRGRHRTIGRDVAIKILNASLAEQDDLVSRFIQEAGVVNAIRHPNIIDVTDFIQAREPRRVAYVMELLPGIPLSRAIAGGPLPVRQAINVAWQMLDALDAVHAAGVVHRDLKPDNIFVTGDLGTDLSLVPSVKILDFGMAKVSIPTAHRTATGTVVGTPAYMAPEQVSGEPVGSWSDLYAWAEIVYEMLSGRPLFRGAATSILHAKLLPEAPSLDLEVGGASVRPLVELLSRFLARVPGVRPLAGEAKRVLYELGAATGTTATRTVVVGRLGDPALAVEAKRTIEVHGGTLVSAASTEGQVAAVFEQARRAVDFAEALHLLAAEVGRLREASLHVSVGLWMGNLYFISDEEVGARGPVLECAGHLAELARPGQTLIASTAADAARRVADEVPVNNPLNWVSHGTFHVVGAHGPVELYEVGAPGRAPFTSPGRTEMAWRLDDVETVTGWRPSSGQPIPGRPTWKIIRRLGEGGFGEVWLGGDSDSGKERIFKFSFGAGAHRSLEREASLIERIRNVLGDRADILRVFDVQVQRAPYYLEAAYVPGGDLKRWLEANDGFEKLSLSERIDIVAQTADALAAAHSVGILHRDVKPSNILIDDRDVAKPRVVLSDFGIGGRIKPEGLAETVVPSDTTEAASGTVLYMSPERLEGRPASIQSDIYSLGVVLYQLLVGNLNRPIASTWGEDIDDPLLREDLAAMLAPAPLKRLRDASEVANRLRNLEVRRVERAEAARREAAALRARRFRRVVIPVVVLLALFGAGMTFQARRIAEEAERANRAAKTASRVSGFLVDLFKVSDPSAKKASKISARDLLDRGAERIERELEEDPLIRAELMDTIGRVYVNLGLYPPATRLTQAALDLREAVLDGDSAKVADSHAALGLVQRLNGQYEEATASHRRALGIRRETLGVDHPDTAQSLTMLAQLAYLRGDPAEARSMYEQALITRERALGSNDAAVAESLTHLGWLDNEQGRFAEGEKRLERALDIRVKALGSDHYLVAETLDLLAANASRRGAYAEAERLTRRGLEIRRKVLDPNHRRIGNSLTSLGTIHRFQGQLTASAGVLKQAVELLTKSLGAEHVDVGLAYFELGLTYEQLGRWGDAKAAYMSCLSVYEEVFGREHPMVGQVLNNLGVAMSDGLRAYAEAEPLIRRAVRILDADGGDAYWRALSQWTLANNLRDQTKYEEAELLYQQAEGILRKLGGSSRVDHPDLPQLAADRDKMRRAAAP